MVLLNKILKILKMSKNSKNLSLRLDDLKNFIQKQKDTLEDSSSEDSDTASNFSFRHVTIKKVLVVLLLNLICSFKKLF